MEPIKTPFVPTAAGASVAAGLCRLPLVAADARSRHSRLHLVPLSHQRTRKLSCLGYESYRESITHAGSDGFDLCFDHTERATTASWPRG